MSEISRQKLSVSAIPATIVFIICLIATIIVWWLQKEQNLHEKLEKLELQAAEINSGISSDMQIRMAALQRLVSRWEERRGTPKNEFERDAGNYVHDIRGIEAISWVDNSFLERWTVEERAEHSSVPHIISTEEQLLLHELKQQKRPLFSKSFKNERGISYFIVGIPVIYDGRTDGYILTEFNIEDWVTGILIAKKTEHVFEDFGLTVLLNNELLFETQTGSENEFNHTAVSSGELLGSPLRVEVWPSDHFYHHHSWINPDVIALAFILFSCILSFLVYFLKKSAVASQQMKIANTILEKESAERLRAEKEAKAASEAKSNFLAAMSHEIRTPMNAVLGILQLLEKQDLPKDVVAKLKTAKHSGNFLLTLVNQVLDFARIESGAVEPLDEEFTVSSMVGDLFSLFSTQTEQKHIGFSYQFNGPEKLWLVGSQSHIKQILFNLIGNAVKFTKQGEVTIKSEICVRDDKTVFLHFEVKDTGPGISKEEQQLVFEAFKQSESGRVSNMGTGLGLSISKNLSDMLDGTLTVESEVGKGSLFRFKVAVKESVVQHVKVDLNDDEMLANPLRILVAEDNSINQMVIEELLKTDGHEVTIVENGAEAFKTVQYYADDFDLILMDIQMPIMNGVEATKAIRNHLNEPDQLPIYALTANAFENQVEEYKKAGMKDVLTKPIDRRLLRKALMKLSGPLTLPAQQNGSNGNGEVAYHTVNKHLEKQVISELMKTLSEEKLTQIIKQINERSAEIIEHLADPSLSFDELEKLSHELKGMASNIGMNALADKAGELEKKSIEEERIDGCLEELRNLREASLENLSRFISSRKGGSSSRKTG
ncbi:MAG: ATP-binding protein [Sneathiellales bacterium]|nr:ATP-binding protein [Sneathiellales bacterium]